MNEIVIGSEIIYTMDVKLLWMSIFKISNHSQRLSDVKFHSGYSEKEWKLEINTSNKQMNILKKLRDVLN